MTCQDVCVVMDYDGYSNAFYREVTRRAAKPHRCCECADVITRGDLYHYATGKTDGVFWDYRTCEPCAEIRETFACHGWIFETLWEETRDQVFPRWNEMTAIDCLARLKTQPAIDKMRAKYAEYCEDRDS